MRYKVKNIVFVATLLCGLIIFLISPKDEFSEIENRRLALFPTISINSIMHGKALNEIDSYVNDHFIARLHFKKIANFIAGLKGIEQDIGIVSRNSVNIAAAVPMGHSQSTNQPNSSPNSEQAFQNIESIIIYNDRAIQLFGGGTKNLKKYNEFLAAIKEKFGKNNKVYLLPIPIGGDYYLPYAVNKGKLKERSNIEYIVENFTGIDKVINVYNSLKEHSGEYIYFNTDHHWTGLGAYYAYVEFCNNIGLNPMPITSLEKGQIHGFLGTLYAKTLSTKLKQNPDYVDYYKVSNALTMKTYDSIGGKANAGKVYYESAKAGGSYGVFLGGDKPLVIIKSGLNEKKILVIKDSYGNAFVPYLAAHYGEVHVVDYRYLNGDLTSYITKNEIRETLFLHNLYVLNNPYTLSREMGMFK